MRAVNSGVLARGSNGQCSATSRFHLQRAHAAVLGCAMLLYGPTGRAQPGAGAPPKANACLTWAVDAASGCPTQAELATAVEAVLGQGVFVAERCDLLVVGSIHHSSDDGWVAELDFGTAKGSSLGTRRLSGSSADCAALRGPVSLVIALMVESAHDSIIVSELGHAGSTKPVPSTRKTDPRALAYADLRTSFGLLPGVSVGTSLGINATVWAALPGRLEATFWLPKSTHQAGPGGQFWGWHAGFALCPVLTGAQTFRAALCTGAQLGLIHGSGFGLDYTESSQRPYGHAEARAVMSIPIWRSLALSPHLGMALPLIRPRFVYLDQADSAVDVHRPNAIVWLGGFGLIWRTSPSSVSQLESPSP